MTLSRLASDGFLVALARWVIANEQEDPTAVRIAGEHVLYAGDLVVLYPEFARKFRTHCPDMEPQAALKALIAFLQCFSDITLPQPPQRKSPDELAPLSLAKDHRAKSGGESMTNHRRR